MAVAERFGKLNIDVQFQSTQLIAMLAEKQKRRCRRIWIFAEINFWQTDKHFSI